MSIDAISGTAQQPLSSAAAAAAAPLQSAPQQSTAVIAPKRDSVELTGTALAKSLKISGQTPAQISQKMGLDIKTVDGYLGLTVVTPPASTAAPGAKTAVADASAAPKPYSAPEEAKESGAQKAAETAQGGK